MADVPSTIADIRAFIKAVKDFKNSNAKSLPERAQPASIMSKIFVDDAIAGEDIMVDLVGALNQLYVSYVFAALGMESYIDECRTVADLTRMISTESLVDTMDVVDNFGKLKPSLEQETYPGQSFEEPPDPQEPHYSEHYDRKAELGAKTVQLESSEQRLVSGRVVEMGVTNKAGTTTNVRVLVQLIPRVIETSIAGAFLGMNIPHDVRKRFKRAMAGEIRFMKDFIFSLDQIQQHRENLKKDRTGDFKEMLSKQNNSLYKYWANIFRIDINYNAASSVLVMDKNTFRKMLSDVGIKKFDEKNKAKFFSKSFMMMLAVVDTDYNTVDLYTSGIKGYGQYSFAEMEKVGSSKGKGMDLKDIMTVFGRGNTASF